MDQERFGALSRALASGVSRRQGIAAALAVVFGGAALDAEAGSGKGKGKGKGTDRGGRRKPGVEGPCGDGSRKDNVCKKDTDCCTGYCSMTPAKKNRDGSGRCRCFRKGKPCTSDQNCCTGLSCFSGICGKVPPMPTCTGAGIYGPSLNQQNGPIGIAVKNDTIYISQFGASKVASVKTDMTGYVESASAFTDQIQGLAFNPADGKLYVVFHTVGQIIEVDTTTLGPASQTPWASGLCSSMYGLVFGADGKAWVTCNLSNDLYHVQSGDTSASPVVSNICTGGGPRGIAFGPGGLLYIACDISSEVVVVDPVSLTKLPQSAPISSAFGVTFVDSQLYVTQFSVGGISRLSVTADNGAPTFTPMCEYILPTGVTPAFSAFDDTGKLWLADFTRNLLLGATLS